MKGIYKYTDLKTGEIVYVGKDSHIDKNQRHKDHLQPSRYDDQPFNKILQNNPNRYEYNVIWATEDCTTLKLNKMEILFGKIYNPKFNFGKFGKGGCKGHTEETKKKLSELNKGKTLSEETKKKLSESMRGENNPNYGKHRSEETKKKMSETRIKNGIAKGKNNPNYGKHHSEETKNKISEAKKGKTLSDEHRQKLSETKNTTGYLNVSKWGCKSCKQGFTWKYSYTENGKRKNITSIDIKKLEQKVKAKGLTWKKVKEE